MEKVARIGSLQNRASHAISNVQWHDIVQDMAAVLETIPARLDAHEVMLKQILEKLNG